MTDLATANIDGENPIIAIESGLLPIENPPSLDTNKVNLRDRFIIFGSIMQIFMAVGDSLAGTFAMLYAVTRGSVGLMQGIIVSVRELGTAILQPIWGVFSDRRGRRYFVFAGFLFQALSWGILMPLATTPRFVLGVVIFQTCFGTMLIPTWNAWIGDRTHSRNRGSTLGYLGFVGSWAGTVMVLAMSFWMERVDPNREFVSTYTIVFRTAGLFYLLAAVVCLIIPEMKRSNGKKLAKMEKLSKSPISRVKERFIGIFYSYKPEFRRLLAVDGAFRVAWSLAWPLFPYATLAATDDWIQIAVVSVISTIATGFSQLYGGRLSDRIGRKKVIQTTRIALVTPPILYSMGVWLNAPIYLFFSNLIIGITLGAGAISMNSLILDIAPDDKQGTYFSTYMTVMGILAFTGSLIMGLILLALSPHNIPSTKLLIALFFLASACRLVAWIGYRYLPDVKPHESTA